MSPDRHVHPRWDGLLRWLETHGMVTHELRVEARSSPGAGYGLFATGTVNPSTPLFSIPATALMNHLTLEPHYPVSRPKLSCTQIVSLHLLLHRPPQNSLSEDTLFGPFISVLPQEVDWHPLTWLWKENEHGPGSIMVETQLLDALPTSITEKLNKMFGTFKTDWKRIQDYLEENPTVACRRARQANCEVIAEWEGDFLWAWLIVNTRCIYHRLASTRSNPDNQTLCPILDFANHTHVEKFAYPGTRAEVFDTGPSTIRKFGENFVLLSPSTSTVVAGEQLFLRYGMHANSTLFAEYGFVNMVDWHNLPGSFPTEVEIDSFVETLFERRGELGAFMKDILLEEGYWRDWTMHTSPSPACPSYRLITALRLCHILPPDVKKLPPSSIETLLDEWRNTTLGKQDVISENNEILWRGSLMLICEEITARARLGQSRIKKVKESGSMYWLDSVKGFIETLWEEEEYVTKEVMKSLQANTDF